MDRKTYQKRLSHIKQEYKGRDSIKKSLIVMLDAQYEYFTSLQNRATVPGLVLGKLDRGLASSAIHEAINCCREMAFNADNYANLRFYINTPYFSRTDDQFPCYDLNDPRVEYLVKIVDSILEQQPDNGQSRDMINIVVRCYWHNHTLTFHSDRKEFGEHVYGAVLCNVEPEQGLILKQGSDIMMLDETVPLWWHMTGESRWNYKHGYCSAIKPPLYNGDPIRISVSFRYYQSDKYIPKKP
jgi:hypothetical protein